MDDTFWHERWARNEIGFHREDTNPFLLHHWPSLNASDSDTVFVPLCGKSVDLIWLAKQCAHVIGVEMSEKAIHDFFDECHISPSIQQNGAFTEYRHENITLLCGDFFQLQTKDLGQCSLIYDRASLIALPTDIRQQYADKLNALCPQPHKRLLITLDYNPTVMNGPPFAVSPDEVTQLFAKTHRLTCLESIDIIEESKRFKDKGLRSLMEYVFLLEKV